MRKETILKTILILTIGVILFAIPVNVFATSNGAADLSEFWEDQGDKSTLEGEKTEPEPTTPEPTTPESTTPTTSTTPEKEEKLPNAGLAEDTMMLVSAGALVVTAVYAFKKVNDYKNI